MKWNRKGWNGRESGTEWDGKPAGWSESISCFYKNTDVHKMDITPLSFMREFKKKKTAMATGTLLN